MKKKALLITTIDFLAKRNGGALYSKYMIEYLNGSCDVEIVVVRQFDKNVLKKIFFLSVALWSSIMNRLPLNVSYYRELGKFALKYSKIDFDNYDFVIFDHVEVFSLYDGSYKGQNVLVAHNIEAKIMHERFGKFKILQRFLFNKKLMENFEKMAFGRADIIICISAQDKKHITEFNPMTCQILPTISRSRNLEIRLHDSVSFGFIGSCEWHPNVEAAKQIVDNYEHLLLKGDKLMIAGDGWASFDWGKLNVTLLGFVTNLESFYSELDFLFCPIISGGGVPVKVLESLNYGVPVITTARVINSIFDTDKIDTTKFGIYLIDDFLSMRQKISNDFKMDFTTIPDDRLYLKELLDVSLS